MQGCTGEATCHPGSSICLLAVFALCLCSPCTTEQPLEWTTLCLFLPGQLISRPSSLDHRPISLLTVRSVRAPLDPESLSLSPTSHPDRVKLHDCTCVYCKSNNERRIAFTRPFFPDIVSGLLLIRLLLTYLPRKVPAYSSKVKELICRGHTFHSLLWLPSLVYLWVEWVTSEAKWPEKTVRWHLIWFFSSFPRREELEAIGQLEQRKSFCIGGPRNCKYSACSSLVTPNIARAECVKVASTLWFLCPLPFPCPQRAPNQLFIAGKGESR